MAKITHTYSSILADLKKGKYAPVYFLYGEEPFYIDKISSYIEDHVLNESEKGFNQSVFYGKDIDIKTLLASCRRFPMMASHQVIIVKEAQNLKQIDEMLTYLEKPLDTTILVVCFKGKSPDKRTKFGKAVEEHVSFDSKKLYENQVPAWIESYLGEKGVKTSQKGLQVIADSLGTEISRIANELDKLLLNSEGKHEISEKTISESIGINRDFNVFELQTAIARRDFERCIRIIQYFSHSKNQFSKPVVLLGSLYSYFNKVYMVHASPVKDERSVATHIGVNPFFVKEYLMAAKNYPPAKLEAIFQTLLDTDLKSKGLNSGSEDDNALLKELIVKIFN